MLDIMIQTCNETFAIIVNDELVDFTTNYGEIEELIEEWCDENNISTWEVNVFEN